jgi:hypothetical protein
MISVLVAPDLGRAVSAERDLQSFFFKFDCSLGCHAWANQDVAYARRKVAVIIFSA